MTSDKIKDLFDMTIDGFNFHLGPDRVKTLTKEELVENCIWYSKWAGNIRDKATKPEFKIGQVINTINDDHDWTITKVNQQTVNAVYPNCKFKYARINKQHIKPKCKQ